eukprot:364194-Chlamydomonas_euryale.AAC.6
MTRRAAAHLGGDLGGAAHDAGSGGARRAREGLPTVQTGVYTVGSAFVVHVGTELRRSVRQRTAGGKDKGGLAWMRTTDAAGGVFRRAG